MTKKPKWRYVPPSREWFIEWLNSGEPNLRFRELLFELTLLQKMSDDADEGKVAPWTPAEVAYAEVMNRRLGGNPPSIFEQREYLQNSIGKKMRRYTGNLTFHLERGLSGRIVDDFLFDQATPIPQDERLAMIALVLI